MTRPRIAAIASAIMASTVAFLLVSRSGLIGTVAGAALIPFIYTLVSHWAKEGFERLGVWLKKRVESEDTESEGTESTDAAPAEEDPEDPPVVVRTPVALWSLGLVAVAALAISGYSLSVKGEGSNIVQERVIEKTVEKTVVVTVVGEQQPPAPKGSAQGSVAGSTTTTEQEPSTTVTDTQESPPTTATGSTSSSEPTDGVSATPPSSTEDRAQPGPIEPKAP